MRLGGNVAAKADQLAADGEVIDHLGIVAGGIGADGRTGQTHQIGGAAEFLEACVILEEGLHRHGRGKRIFLDAGGGAFEDAGVNGVKEMFRPHQRGDAVIDIVIGQDRAQKLLFSLDIMGQGVGFRSCGRQDLPQGGEFVHVVPCLP